jgi:hypothetical protein
MKIETGHIQEATYGLNDINNLIMADLQKKLGGNAYSIDNYDITYHYKWRIGTASLDSVEIKLKKTLTPLDTAK